MSFQIHLVGQANKFNEQLETRAERIAPITNHAQQVKAFALGILAVLGSA